MIELQELNTSREQHIESLLDSVKETNELKDNISTLNEKLVCEQEKNEAMELKNKQNENKLNKCKLKNKKLKDKLHQQKLELEQRAKYEAQFVLLMNEKNKLRSENEELHQSIDNLKQLHGEQVSIMTTTIKKLKNTQNVIERKLSDPILKPIPEATKLKPENEQQKALDSNETTVFFFVLFFSYIFLMVYVGISI